MSPKNKYTIRTTPSPPIVAVASTDVKGLFRINGPAEVGEEKAPHSPHSNQRPLATGTGTKSHELRLDRPVARRHSKTVAGLSPVSANPAGRRGPPTSWKPKSAIAKGFMGKFKLKGHSVPRPLTGNTKTRSNLSVREPSSPNERLAAMSASPGFLTPRRAPGLPQRHNSAVGGIIELNEIVFNDTTSAGSPCSKCSTQPEDEDNARDVADIPKQGEKGDSDTIARFEKTAPGMNLDAIQSWFGWSVPRSSRPVTAPLHSADDVSLNFDRIIDAVALKSSATEKPAGRGVSVVDVRIWVEALKLGVQCGV